MKENARRRCPAYKSWLAMIHRVHSKKNASYKNYGKRGITVCDRWMDFEKFYEDMGDRPVGKSLDRIDSNSGYSKENCQWATMKEQQRNRNNNRILDVGGVKHCVAEWSEISGIHFNIIHLRLCRGWSSERAVNTKVRVYART